MYKPVQWFPGPRGWATGEMLFESKKPVTNREISPGELIHSVVIIVNNTVL